METFNVEIYTPEKVVLQDERQIETLLECIKESKDVMIRWQEDSNGDKVKRSLLLTTDGLMSRVKDGRFEISSSKLVEKD